MLEPIVAKYALHGVTRADIWALAAISTADFLKGGQNTIFSFDWYGRPTCDQRNDTCLESDCSKTRGPDRKLPSSDLDTHGMLAYFNDTFGLTAKETVALMGVHTAGLVHREFSGFVGDGWSKTHAHLDNTYYVELVGAGASLDDRVQGSLNWTLSEVNNSDLVGIPNRFEWTQNKLVMLNADIALVRDFSGYINKKGKVNCTFLGGNACPVAVDTMDQMTVYRNNGTLWLEDFRDVLSYMLEFPYNTSGGCDKELCLIGEVTKDKKSVDFEK